MPFDREWRVQNFGEESKLIPQALEALRALRPELQDKILNDGPIQEGEGNPIIVLMKRIKEVASWAQKEYDEEEELKKQATEMYNELKEIKKKPPELRRPPF